MSVLAGETFALFDVEWNLNVPSESARRPLLAMKRFRFYLTRSPRFFSSDRKHPPDRADVE